MKKQLNTKATIKEKSTTSALPDAKSPLTKTQKNFSSNLEVFSYPNLNNDKVISFFGH